MSSKQAAYLCLAKGFGSCMPCSAAQQQLSCVIARHVICPTHITHLLPFCHLALPSVCCSASKFWVAIMSAVACQVSHMPDTVLQKYRESQDPELPRRQLGPSHVPLRVLPGRAQQQPGRGGGRCHLHSRPGRDARGSGSASASPIPAAQPVLQPLTVGTGMSAHCPGCVRDLGAAAWLQCSVPSQRCT